MLATLIQKELKNILLSPKFVATFAVCSILLLLSVYVGIQEYQVASRHYDTAAQLVSQELRQQSQWISLNNRTYRKPDPMQIFVSGIQNDIGRWSSVNQLEPVKLRHSAYSDDPIFALFRFIDFSFITQVVLSLFAFLFTYNAVNGERESGTLALTFSNSVPRARYLVAKLVGSWLGLIVPLLVPIGLMLLLLDVFRIPLDAEHWFQLLALLGVSMLYVTFFIALGLLASTLTRRSNVSFLLCLVAWVLFVLILPRISAIIAGHAIPVPTIAEVEARQDAYAKDRWESHKQELEQRLRERQSAMANMSKEKREEYENDHMWNWMEDDDAKRRQMQKEVDAFGVVLQEDLRSRRATQERLAFTLSRFSPASAYQLAVMDIGGTDIGLKTRYEDAIRSYRTTFNNYTQQKQKESGGTGGMRITVDTDKGVSIDTPREKGTLNLTDVPQFDPPHRVFIFPVVDITILLVAALIAFAGSFVGFLRYDVRS